jgi:hypothetical protein
MKNIELVKVIITKTPVERFLKSVIKKFVFYGYYFEDCETIEEVRDKFYQESEDVIDFIEIYTYRNEKDLKQCKQDEALAE